MDEIIVTAQPPLWQLMMGYGGQGYRFLDSGVDLQKLNWDLSRLDRELSNLNNNGISKNDFPSFFGGALGSRFSAMDSFGSFGIYFTNLGKGRFVFVDYAKIGKIGGGVMFGVTSLSNLYRFSTGQITKGEAGFNITLGGIGVINPVFAIPYGITDALYPGGFGQGLKDVGQFKIERWESMPDWLKGHTLDVKTYQ